MDTVTASAALVEMAMAYSRSRVLCAAARLGVADALGDTERSVEELAAACGADAQGLYRLLRTLASLGITVEVSPGRFVLSPLGQPLRKGSVDSAWPGVVFWSDLLADNWSYLTECVRTGKRAGEIMEEAGIASRWSTDPDAGAIFRAVMGAGSTENYMPIVDAWDFSGHHVVADLGGGGGALLAALLMKNPHLHGILVDRPESVEAARPRFSTKELMDRVKLIPADLRNGVPEGADVYMLKHVLHGYEDAVTVEILSGCRRVIRGGGRLLVIEFVLPDVVNVADVKLQTRLLSDLNMLAVTGGRERSTGEWTALLQAAGFSVVKIVPVAGLEFSIIEALGA